MEKKRIKETIVSLLQANGSMTQSDLAKAIFGDRFHMSNIYSALVALVKSNIVSRTDVHPAKYSLSLISAGDQTVILENTDLSKIENIGAQSLTTNISAEYAIQLIRDYFHETVNDEHSRYMSWHHCYKVFLENRNKLDEQIIDYLALHLAFYLASWGMYRGSSFLLQKDYKVHIPIIKIIQDKKYNPLLGISAENLCMDKNLDLLDDISRKIKRCYAEEIPAFEGIVNNATDTLVTKILLGALGCVPAYDRYYVQSVKKYHISSGIYNRNSIYCIAKFYCDNLVEFEKLRSNLNKCGIEYPPMKLMDMCFWQEAHMNDLKQR